MRKHEVLQQFAHAIYEADPEGICCPDNPHGEAEYDGEALSILARFTEAHLASAEPQQAQELALLLVQQAWEFWFTNPIRDEETVKNLSTKLLNVYLSSYPTHDEQHEEPSVGS